VAKTAVNIADEKKVVAAKYYMTSAEQGDILGCHWLGVFYHEGFGVGVGGVAGDRAAEEPVLENLWLRCTA
jgi:TPR repeat protein